MARGLGAKIESERQYLDSITTALRAYRMVEDYVQGGRPAKVTKEEIREGISVPVNRMWPPGTFPKNLTVVGLWERAQWCRERDALRWLGLSKDCIHRMSLDGYFVSDVKPWFGRKGELALKLYDVYHLAKYMKLRPFVRSLGNVNRGELYTFSRLPLSALLGLLADPSEAARVFRGSVG